MQNHIRKTSNSAPRLARGISYIVDAYSPQLLGSTTNPNLGDDGQAVGAYHVIGQLLTGWAQFLFAGSGISAGSGVLSITTPLPADPSLMISGGVGGAGTSVGTGKIRDNSTSANSKTVYLQLDEGGHSVFMQFSNANSSVSATSPIPWEVGDRISINFAYLIDPLAI
jgi:hypothetical protein